jgi:hypothetical protein
MKIILGVTLCIGMLAAVTVILARVYREGDRHSDRTDGIVTKGLSERGGGAGEASEIVSRRMPEVAESTNSVSIKAGSPSQSEGDGLRIPRVGERIGNDRRNAYVTKLLAAGFQKNTQGAYVARGLSLETVKQLIEFDDTIGQTLEPVGCLPVGDTAIGLKMPFVRARLEYINLGTTNLIETVIHIHEMAIDAKAKPKQFKLEK